VYSVIKLCTVPLSEIEQSAAEL